MRLKTLLAVAATGALAAPCVVLAQSAATTQQQARAGAKASAALFDRLDKNKDGFVSRDEAKDATELQGRFAELDQDNDGRISRSEMRGIDSDRHRGAAGASKAKR